MKMRYLILLNWCGFAISGCISGDSVTTHLDSWKGQSRQAVEKYWGKSFAKKGNSLVYFARDTGVYSSSYNYLDSASADVIKVHDGQCKVVFSFDPDNVVKDLSWSGSLGRCYQYTLERSNKL